MLALHDTEFQPDALRKKERNRKSHLHKKNACSIIAITFNKPKAPTLAWINPSTLLLSS